jgi:hypothetical protein
MIKNTSKGLYLKASSVNSFTLASKDVMDGKQLWYVEWTGSGYKLYSMGVKISNGTNEAMLRGNTPGNSPILQTSLSDKNWSISYSSGYYYLVSTSTSYNGASLSAESSGSYVKCIDLDSETDFARWEFEEISTSTFNNYFTGSYLGQGTHIYIKISADSSLYVNNYVSTNAMNSVNAWNGISSNVTIYDLDDSVPSSITTFSIEYRGYTEDDGRYGYTQGYKKTLLWYNEVSLNEDFSKVVIFINTSDTSSFADESDEELIKKVIIHELGHALKLAHPMEPNGLQPVLNARNNYPYNDSVLAVMNQGNPSDPNLTSCICKWHDKINLKNKWGY